MRASFRWASVLRRKLRFAAARLHVLLRGPNGYLCAEAESANWVKRTAAQRGSGRGWAAFRPIARRNAAHPLRRPLVAPVAGGVARCVQYFVVRDHTPARTTPWLPRYAPGARRP